jgi:AcrR family transcriptional regulator
MTVQTAPQDGVPRRGRPRDPEVDKAIMVATLDGLVHDGFAHLTMEGVADRAGVGKASLYRRWPNKVALVVDTLRRLAEERIVLPDTGTVHDDMLAYLRAIVRTRRTESEVLSAIGHEVASNAELAKALRQEILPVLSRPVVTIIRRGIERGELPPSTDVDLLAAVGPALVHHRRMTTGQGADERFARRIVEQFYPRPARRTD